MQLNIRQLASQTAVYGLSSIIAKVLNYLLTPLLTGIFEPSVYAIISELYSYIAIMLAILTFGMETALFRFGSKIEEVKSVFGSSFTFVSLLTGVFFILVVSWADNISIWLKYPGHSDYVVMFSIIIALDALSALPQARLRQENRPGYFALVNLGSILVSVGLIVFWLIICRQQYLTKGSEAGFFVKYLYNHNLGVAYVFISNVIASAFKLGVLMPVIFQSFGKPDLKKILNMFQYAWPLAIGSVCFIINEKSDILFLTHILPKDHARHAVGVYGACYKIALLMYLFIQAFRFAAEPYFFAQQGKKDARLIYSEIMTWFVAFCLGLFLFINMFIHLLKYFISQPLYWEGLHIVPIISAAILLSGVYLNLSMWYKLTGQTRYGMYFSILGASVTIILNVSLIPLMGYLGSAWATFFCYLIMVIVSFIIGQKQYPIPYQIKKLGYIFLVSALIFISFKIFEDISTFIRYFTAIVGLNLYILIVYKSLLLNKNLNI